MATATKKTPKASTKSAATATAKSGVSQITKPNDRSFRVERVFNAPRDKVWRAYTEAKLLAQWWGRGNKLDVVTFEPRTGGRWRVVEHSDGQTHGFEGKFREVTPKDRIVQTFEYDGMPGHVILETAEFSDAPGGGTKLTGTSLFFTTEERDGMLATGMTEGMNESFAALDKLLATI